MKVNIGEYKEKRDVLVEIEEFDVWNLDHTLAMVIYPALVLLKSAKQGSPIVDNEDVPEALRRPEGLDEHGAEGDEHYFDRWDYVLDEMIWAFAQIADDDNDSQFHTGTHDKLFQGIDENGDFVGEPFPVGEDRGDNDAKFYEMVKGPNDTSHFNSEAYRVHHERIKRGTTLFGKYYSGLWD